MPLAALFVVGLVLSSLLGRGLTAFAFMGGLLAYVLISYTSPSSRFYPIAFLAGIHVGAVLTYYTKPVPLPFMIVELSPFGALLNVDIVQVIVTYELIGHYLEKKAGRVALQQAGGEGHVPIAERQGTSASGSGEGASAPGEGKA